MLASLQWRTFSHDMTLTWLYHHMFLTCKLLQEGTCSDFLIKSAFSEMQSVVQSVELYINYATAQSYSCIFSTSSSSNLLCGSHNWSFLLTCLLHVICSVCVCLHEKVRSLRAPKGKNSSNAVKTLSWNETTQNKIGVLWIDLLLPPPPSLVIFHH